MLETPDEVDALQALMDASHASGTQHLQEIVAGDRRLDAQRVLASLAGMRVLSLATVTSQGEPRVSAVDGHLLHGRWTFGTSGASAKARHLERRPSVSAAHVDGERLGVFCHGRAHRLTADDPTYAETIAHWTEHYGSDPTTWGPDVRMYRIDPTWFVGYGDPSPGPEEQTAEPPRGRPAA